MIKSKRIYIIIGSFIVISSLVVGGLAIKIYQNKSTSMAAIENKLSIIEADNVGSITEDKKIYITSEYMFAYRPTVEKLYKNADVVVIGKYNSDLNTSVKGINISTETQFNVSKVIKNTTKLDVNKSVIFNRSGGTVSLDKYMDNNSTIKEGEFENIKANERKKYYVIQEYGPENKLDFSKARAKSSEYILFLKLTDGKLNSCASYHGIKEIQDSKVYDYDFEKFIEIDNTDINKALNKK